MKRELKFRAWHIELKEMLWWDIMWGNHNYGDGYIGMVPWGKLQTTHLHRDNMILVDPFDCEIMQFTGLKDKNGREIYEGDIINDDGIIMFIEFVQGAFCKCNDNGNWIIHSCDKIEVIGNIYENSELLKTES